MQFAVERAFALLPTIDSPTDWKRWAQNPALPAVHEFSQLPKRLPMMVARRLSLGARLAVETALELSVNWAPDAVVFSSRHGELERGEKLLATLAAGQNVSPTDFMMSVHNAAAGTYSIQAKCPLPVSSVSAGTESFSAALMEAYAFIAAGYQRVLVVDFEGPLPPLLGAKFPEPTPSVPYALGIALESATSSSKQSAFELTLECHHGHADRATLPQALSFYASLIAAQPSFDLVGSLHTLHGEWHHACE